MALDYFAIASMGTYPTPATTNQTERAYFAATFGLRDSLTEDTGSEVGGQDIQREVSGQIIPILSKKYI